MLEIKCDVFGSLENNCYLITDAATQLSALVDCTDSSDRMMRLISGCELKYILLTHGHYDHIGGVRRIKETTGAKVVIGAEDERMLSSSRASLAAFCGCAQDNTSADITVGDGDVITLGESRISVMSAPGHTEGGRCYICDNNIFTGDTLFYLSCGRTDFPGGSDEAISESLRRIASLDGDYNVYPGHNRATTLDFERKNNPYLKLP